MVTLLWQICVLWWIMLQIHRLGQIKGKCGGKPAISKISIAMVFSTIFIKNRAHAVFSMLPCALGSLMIKPSWSCFPLAFSFALSRYCSTKYYCGCDRQFKILIGSPQTQKYQ